MTTARKRYPSDLTDLQWHNISHLFPGGDRPPGGAGRPRTYELREVAAYIGIESPEKRCGKTTLLTVLSELVNRPVVAANISPNVKANPITIFSILFFIC